MSRLCFIIFLFLAGCFSFVSLISAGQINGLQEIYNTCIPGEIRRNFDEYLHMRETCPECAQQVLDAEQYLDIYDKEFLVIGFYPNSFGGVWAIIVVKGKALRAFRLWMYDISSHEYDWRCITELTGSFDKEAMQKLCSADYEEFWL